MFPIIRKLSSKRASFEVNTISRDCVGVADHVWIDTNCLLSPQQSWGKAWFNPIVIELLLHHFSNFSIFLGENVTV